MSRNSGGGKATTCGIDFQHRFGAWLLICTWLRIDVSNFIGVSDPILIKELGFETNDDVDDIRVVTESGSTIYFQVKTSLSLSDLPDSVFGGVVAQFIRQSVQDQAGSTELVILTSSSASKRITSDLSTVIKAIRDNPEGYAKSPFNVKQDEALTKYRSLFNHHFASIVGAQPNEEEFVVFSAKLSIEVFDVHAGGAFEKAAKLLLVPHVSVSSDLLWSMLLKTALGYGGSRAVISADAINSLMQPYKTEESTSVATEATVGLIASEGCQWNSGKEVVLIESFVEELDYMIVEMARFKPTGEKKFEFVDDTIIVPAWQNPVKVIHRCATVYSIERFLEENQEQFEGSHIAAMMGNFDEDPNELPAAKVHAEMCDKKFRQHARQLRCLHCDHAVNEPRCFIIEVDERGIEHDAGICHPGCLRPVDRVVGVVQLQGASDATYLRTIDVTEWAKRLVKGQIGIREAIEISLRQGSPVPMAWNSDNSRKSHYSHCVRFELQDGSRQYVTARGRIDRMRKPEAEFKSSKLNELISESRAKNNPVGYTTETTLYGHYSLLLRMKDSEEGIVLCTKAEALPYSNAAEPRPAADWYAPLFFLVDAPSELSLTIGRSVPLLSNPLKAESFVENWTKAGITVEDFELRMIGNDLEFDSFMEGATHDGMQVVVDPILDLKGTLVTGVVVTDIEIVQNRLQEMAEGHEGGDDNEQPEDGDG